MMGYGVFVVRPNQISRGPECPVNSGRAHIRMQSVCFEINLYAVSFTNPIFSIHEFCNWIGLFEFLLVCVSGRENYSAAVLVQLIYLCWDRGRKLAWVVSHKSPTSLLKYGSIKGATQIYTLPQSLWYTRVNTDLHPWSPKTAGFCPTRTTSTHRAHHCIICQNINTASC